MNTGTAVCEQLFGVRNKADEAVFVSRDWMEEAEASGRICRRCDGILGDDSPLDIVIKGPPPRATESCVRIAEHDVVERRMLDVIGWDVVERAAVVSRLLDESGKEYGDFCVIRPRHWTCIRASRLHVGRNPLHCPQCGRCLGALWGHRRVYVVQSSLGEGPLWAANGYPLLVDEGLHQRLRAHRWRHLVFDRIPIVDKPRDGLPEHIEHYVPVTRDGVDWFFDK